MRSSPDHVVGGGAEVIESEVKVLLGGEDSLEDARRRVSRLCRYVERVRQVDVYYNHPCRDFAETDEALRVRKVNDGERCVLTYKGPRSVEEGVKSRLELKSRVEPGDCGVLEKMLESLGFREVARVVKEREKYQCPGGFKVVLDRVEGLGVFVEVEKSGGEEAAGEVRRFLEGLGIGGRLVEETYLEMIMRRSGAGEPPIS